MKVIIERIGLDRWQVYPSEGSPPFPIANCNLGDTITIGQVSERSIHIQFGLSRRDTKIRELGT